MPGWGEILTELSAEAANNPGGSPFDAVRRKYLVDLQLLTGRSTIIYAADFLNKGGPQIAINLADMQGLMEVYKGLPGPSLDIILHSPGGNVEAANRIVDYTRSRFTDVRVFVPLAAMSAATMWALSCDVIVMGAHSQLGPIDPQITLPNGLQMPAGSLVRQFAKASEECAKDPTRLAGWMSTLQQYPPGLLEICEQASELGQELVAQWLATYMLKGESRAKSKAKKIAEFFADDSRHKSHGRPLDRDVVRQHGVHIENLEDDAALQDAVLSVHHATMHSLASTSTAKIVENHMGRAFVVNMPPMAVPFAMPPVMVPAPAPPPGP